MSSKRVLVTGATGQQGGAVARLLLSRGHGVRALVRNPVSPAAADLRSRGAEIVQGTMDEVGPIRKAMESVDAVFLVTTPFEAGMDAEVGQGRNVADAARDTATDLVFTSVAWAWAKTGIPHFESKEQIEEHIRALEIPHTIIGPCYFMENSIAPWSIEPIRRGMLAVPLSEGVRVPQIATENIAEFAVLAIEQRDRMLGRRVDIAGDVLTGPECAAILSRASGREIRYQAVPLEAVRGQSEDLWIMFSYFEAKQPSLDVEALRREYPEVQWRTYEQWARAQDWDRILG